MDIDDRKKEIAQYIGKKILELRHSKQIDIVTFA